jgi:hypothetical protein
VNRARPWGTTIALTFVLLLAAGCHRHVSLWAPKAMLADVLYVELDHIVDDGDVIDVGGSVANLTTDTIWLDPMHWRLVVHGVETKPAAPASVHEIPGLGVAYVRLMFPAALGSAAVEDAPMLVVGGVSGQHGAFPPTLGAIPLSRGEHPPDIAAAVPRATQRDVAKQPSGEELLERDCGSGPLVTCPR